MVSMIGDCADVTLQMSKITRCCERELKLKKNRAEFAVTLKKKEDRDWRLQSQKKSMPHRGARTAWRSSLANSQVDQVDCPQFCWLQKQRGVRKPRVAKRLVEHHSNVHDVLCPYENEISEESSPTVCPRRKLEFQAFIEVRSAKSKVSKARDSLSTSASDLVSQVTECSDSSGDGQEALQVEEVLCGNCEDADCKEMLETPIQASQSGSVSPTASQTLAREELLRQCIKSLQLQRKEVEIDAVAAKDQLAAARAELTRLLETQAKTPQFQSQKARLQSGIKAAKKLELERSRKQKKANCQRQRDEDSHARHCQNLQAEAQREVERITAQAALQADEIRSLASAVARAKIAAAEEKAGELYDQAVEAAANAEAKLPSVEVSPTEAPTQSCPPDAEESCQNNANSFEHVAARETVLVSLVKQLQTQRNQAEQQAANALAQSQLAQTRLHSIQTAKTPSSSPKPGSTSSDLQLAKKMESERSRKQRKVDEAQRRRKHAELKMHESMEKTMKDDLEKMKLQALAEVSELKSRAQSELKESQRKAARLQAHAASVLAKAEQKLQEAAATCDDGRAVPLHTGEAETEVVQCATSDSCSITKSCSTEPAIALVSSFERQSEDSTSDSGRDFVCDWELLDDSSSQSDEWDIVNAC